MISTLSTPPTTTTPTNNIKTVTLFLGSHKPRGKENHEIYSFKIYFYK